MRSSRATPTLLPTPVLQIMAAMITHPSAQPTPQATAHAMGDRFSRPIAP